MFLILSIDYVENLNTPSKNKKNTLKSKIFLLKIKNRKIKDKYHWKGRSWINGNQFRTYIFGWYW